MISQKIKYKWRFQRSRWTQGLWLSREINTQREIAGYYLPSHSVVSCFVVFHFSAIFFVLQERKKMKIQKKCRFSCGFIEFETLRMYSERFARPSLLIADQVVYFAIIFHNLLFSVDVIHPVLLSHVLPTQVSCILFNKWKKRMIINCAEPTGPELWLWCTARWWLLLRSGEFWSVKAHFLALGRMRSI